MRLRLIFVFFLAVLAVKGNSNVTRQQRVVSIPDFVRKFFASLITEHLSKHARQGNANEYFDKLLINVRQYLVANYDPLKLYDLTSELKSIHVEGLSTVARTGSSSVHGKNDDLILESHLGFHKFKAKANIEKHLWWVFWLCGICSVDIRGIDLYLRVRAKFLDDRLKLHLESIDIIDWGLMSSSFQGTNWIGNVVSAVTYLFPSTIKGWLKNNIPTMLFDGVKDALSSATFTWSDFDWPSVKSQQMLLNVHKNKREIVD